MEGFTDDVAAFLRLIEALKDYNPPPADTVDGFELLTLAMYREDMLRIGAAGKLLMAGDLDDVLPAEDAEAYAAANPVQADGSVVLDMEAQERREDAIVRRLLASGEPVMVLVLGEGHDLADNIKRLGVKCRYRRVE